MSAPGSPTEGGGGQHSLGRSRAADRPVTGNGLASMAGGVRGLEQQARRAGAAGADAGLGSGPCRRCAVGTPMVGRRQCLAMIPLAPPHHPPAPKTLAKRSYSAPLFPHCFPGGNFRAIVLRAIKRDNPLVSQGVISWRAGEDSNLQPTDP